MRLVDLTGMKFGELTVSHSNDERSSGSVVWTCMCDCGNVTNVISGNLIRGNTLSCGHLKGKSFTHNCSNTPEYETWSGMKERCTNPNNKSYHCYGGRGITVCERWLCSFENFLSDMGFKPSSEHSLDREDTNGNYEPGNCKWSTAYEQANNRRNNRIVYYNGKEYTIAQLAKEYHIYYETLRGRLDRGWSVERAVETPIGRQSGNFSI